MKKVLFLVFFLAASLTAAPQAIVFDFGGVLTGEPDRGIVIEFIQKTLQLSRQEFGNANREKRLFVQQGGSDEVFWRALAEKRGVVLAPDWSHSFQEVLLEAVKINPRMFALVDELRKRQIRVGLLSNIDDHLAKLVREFGLYDPFDPCLLSCDIGVEKPDAKAYLYLLEKLGFPAKDVVFIDDRLENIEAAKSVGLDAILFLSEEQLREELGLRGTGI